MGWSNIPRYRMCCLQNMKRPNRHCDSFFVVRETWWNNLIFTLDGVSQHASKHLDLSKFYSGGRLLDLCKTYLNAKVHASYQGLRCASCFLFIYTNKRDIIKVWNNAIFCGMSRWLGSFQTILWHRTGKVNIALRQKYECILMFIPYEFRLLLVPYLIGKEKNALVKSVAVYYVPGAILICPRKDTTSGSAVAIGDPS